MSTLFGDEMTTAAQGKKTNEWYTPSVYIEAARSVMGSIDLDPASSEQANKTVKATKYYSKKDNGLLQPWYGCIWLNPPFNKENGKSTIGKWASRIIQSYQSGEIIQATVLVAGQTSSRWFQHMWEYPICFTDHYIRFYCPQLKRYKDQRDCTLFIYLGPNEDKFIDVFSKFGRIAKAIDIPKSAQATQASLWTSTENEVA